MPNVLDANGLTVATEAELVAADTAAFKSIYGNDINLDQNSPDGQMMRIRIRSVLDLENLLVQIYNAFDPDNAIGTTLDQRVAINGIQRQAGTFTVTDITITTSQALNLYGLNQTDNEVFTVADNAGNKWELQFTQVIGSAGTYVFSFQAAIPGAVLTLPNTITVPVTIVLGVTTINNPTTYTTLGLNEESDMQLKIRRAKSVALPSQGYLAGLLAALENLNGVTSAFVYENNSDSTDGDGVPSHSIWVIVAGTATAADIAGAIYAKRNAGCGMFGAETYEVLQVDGTLFPIFWDTVVPLSLFAKFTWTALDNFTPSNITKIIADLATTFIPGVNEEVNINELATKVQASDPNTLVTNAGFSLTAAGVYTNTLSPTTKKNQFTSPTLIILPIILTPYNPVTAAHIPVVNGASKQFTALGGYGAYTYSISVNNSGGSITVGGLYTAGGTFPVTDTVHVVDSLGNAANALVDVTA